MQVEILPRALITERKTNMIIPIEEREEILVCNDNKELIIELRGLIAKKFPRTWIYVHHNGFEKWGIEVANNWGSPLPKDTQSQVEEFVEKFMLDHQPEPEESSEEAIEEIVEKVDYSKSN
jgi:hypothetical protein